MSRNLFDIFKGLRLGVALLAVLWGCSVHEWPDPKENVDVILKLSHETEFLKWEHLYDGDNMIETGVGPEVESVRKEGCIRHIVRIYPTMGKQRAVDEHIKEYVVTRDIADGYDGEIAISLPPGEYNVYVWSDLTPQLTDTPSYNTDNFFVIKHQGEYRGNNEYRDAFRGIEKLTVVSDYTLRTPDTLDVAMQRPMAKFEFVTTDLVEFIEKEVTRITRKNDKNEASQPAGVDKTRVNIGDYTVRLTYNYLRDNYSFITDRPMFSRSGVSFESYINALNKNEAVLGFDYALVNGADTKVSVTISVFDGEGEEISTTNLLEVPLKRNRHTVMKGMFLMENAVGGVTINPDYSGDHNLIFPK